MNSSDRTTPRDGGGEQPEVYSLTRSEVGWKLSRREFVTASAVALASAALGGCGGGGASGTDPKVGPGLAHSGRVLSATISPTGTVLVSGGSEGLAKLWRLDLRGFYRADDFESGPVSSLSIAADHVLYAATSGVDAVSLPSGDFGPHATTQSGGPRCVAVLADESAVAVADGDVVRLLAPSDLSQVSHFQAHGQIYSMAAIPGTTHVVTGDVNGRVQRWSAADGRLVWEQSDHTQTISAVAASKDGTLVITASLDGTFETRRVEDGVKVTAVKPKVGRIYSVALTPDNAYAATALSGGAVYLWSLPGGTWHATLDKHSGPVRCVAIHPDRSLVVTGGDDSTLRLWSLPNGLYLTRLLDLSVSSVDASGATYTGPDTGTTVFTVPCSAPMPRGWVCSCNCVRGDICACDSHGCSCDYYYACVCNVDPGCSCHGHAVCSCDSHTSCTCDSNSGCSCDGYSCSCDGYSCSCDGYSCSCDDDYACSCDDYSCSCDSDTSDSRAVRRHSAVRRAANRRHR